MCVLLFYLNSIFVFRKVTKKIFVGNLQPDETVDAAQEANLLRSLDHPNIVKFYDSFVDGEFFCIVTEFCECVFCHNFYVLRTAPKIDSRV